MSDDTNQESTLPKLTRRRQRFADEFLSGCTAAEAYRRAGLAKGVQDPQKIADAAYRIRTRSDVQAYLRARRKDLGEATDIRPEQIARELKLIGFANLKRFYNDDGTLKPIKDISEEDAAALFAIETEKLFEGRGEAREYVGDVLKVKLFNKVEALEKLAKLLGYTNDKIDIDLSAPPPNVTVMMYEDADDAERAARAAVSGHKTPT